MRTLRALLVIVIVVVAAMFVMGYLNLGPQRTDGPASVGTTGAVDRARERGAELGEKAAVATAKVQETLAEAALTTKIKAKMALDDSVKARAIDVTTHETTVTLNGTVASAREHQRAVDLARETAGVTRVVDNLQIR
jgi:hypothetical protein